MVLDHHRQGGCGREEHSHPSSQEAEKENACSSEISPFPPFIPYCCPVSGMVLSTWACLAPIVNPLWELPYRHTQQCALLIPRVFQPSQIYNQD
jgi:hypothetical protein